jgi:predicted dehydrogenase
MPDRVRWGVLGISSFAMQKPVPAMLRSERCEVLAVASREVAKAREAAGQLGISCAYGSYEELLADPEIEVIYNPLPNHLHVPWSIRALEAGKHVLCEKPLGLSAAEVRQLMEASRRTDRLAAEAFMVRVHPQWIRAREIARSVALGELRVVAGGFSYFNPDPANVRNVPEFGGGGLYDIGCYCVYTSRLLFGEEPVRVAAQIEMDPQFGVDRLVSALLAFPSGQALFHCATQLVPYQRVQVFGTQAMLEIEVPFNAPPDAPTRLWIDDGSDLQGGSRKQETFPVCDQYTIQGDRFSDAVRGREAPAVSLEDSLCNALVLDALFRAGKSGRWEEVGASGCAA